MVRSQEFKVGEDKYETTQFPARKSNRMLIRLGKIIGPVFAIVLKDVGKTKSKKQKDEIVDAALQQSVNALFDNVDEEKVDDLITQLFSTTVCIADGKRTPLKQEIIDIHFAGRLGHMYKVLVKVLGVQYGDFLSEIAELQGKAQAMVQR